MAKGNTYYIFFSWQSDKPEIRKMISAELNKVKKALSAEGYVVEIDQDTRGRIGTRNIESDVLEKIKRCDVFVADLTPICLVTNANQRIRLVPNPNVIYECGYAVAQKGMNRIILLSYLADGESIEQLPFDINHNTISNIRDQQQIISLYHRIKAILEDAYRQRQNQKKEYECEVFFTENNQGYERIAIHPKYKKIQYVSDNTSLKGSATATQAPTEMSTREMFTSYLHSIQKTKSIVPPQDLVGVKTYSQIINHASCPIQLTVANIGERELDNIYLFVHIETSGVYFAEGNTESVGLAGNFKHHDYMIEDNGDLKAHVMLINPDMMQILDSVYLEIPYGIETVSLKWTILAARHKQEGILKINVEPIYENEIRANSAKAGTEEIISYLERK